MMALLDFDPAVDFKLLLLVPLIPLLGYVVQISFRKRLPWGDKLLTGGMFVVMCITVFMALKAITHAYGHHGEPFLWESWRYGFQFDWLYSTATSTPNIVAGILYDPLGASMLAVVGIVSFCVHLFSIGYMHGDKRYNIFFANISLFTFAMLGLVLSDNILFLFVFWEIMGLMSYLLIGHFAHDPSQPFFHKWATWASKKAFMTTRVGDVCLLIGMLMFYREFHTLRFTELWEAARQTVAANGGEFPAWMTVAGLFTFGGTIGKSAQFPLHIWLPDAMAGPTPVSAMIHAATMVAAGVFLLGRVYPLLSPDVLAVVTVVGATTALFAATIGTTAYDLKGVLAWSTISQLGFMVAAVGLGGVVAGMFHMVTHAFFKACLFLSAGSVIHGCHHVQDMRVMGGLRKQMPITFACMTICTLAIAGVPFFAGFYSKDMILLASFAKIQDGRLFDGWAVYALLTLAVAAALTAFYMFRLVFMTFFGEYRGNMAQHRYSAMLAAEGYEGPAPHADHGEDHEHAGHADDAHAHGHHAGHDADAHEPHESPRTIVVALCILAFFGVFGGHFWLADPGHVLHFWSSHPWFTELVTLESLYGSEVGEFARHGIAEGIWDHASHAGHSAHGLALGVSLAVATSGILLAYLLYVRRRDLPSVIVSKLGIVYTTVRRKYYVDEAIAVAVIQPCFALARILKTIDERVVDGFVLAVGAFNRTTGFFSAWFDRVFVDGLVNAVGSVSQVFGSVVRLLQTGRIQQYAAFAVGGALLTAAWLILA